MVKATKATGDIASALELGGLKHSSKDFNTTVRSVLGGREDFLRVNGDWGLTEWYPGMRNKDKKVTLKQPSPIKSVESTIANEMESHKSESLPKAKKNWVPSGYGLQIVEMFCDAPAVVFSAKDVAAYLGTNKIPSVASLLSDLATKGRIGRGEKSGYKANEETMKAWQRAGLAKNPSEGDVK